MDNITKGGHMRDTVRVCTLINQVGTREIGAQHGSKVSELSQDKSVDNSNTKIQLYYSCAFGTCQHVFQELITIKQYSGN